MYKRQVVDSDVERLQLMKQEKEILERQSRRAGGGQVRVGGDSEIARYFFFFLFVLPQINESVYIRTAKHLWSDALDESAGR